MLRRLTLALAASTMLYGVPQEAHAEPISTAISLTAFIATTFSVSVATAGAIGGFIVGLGITSALNLVSTKLLGKPGAASPTTAQPSTTVALGGDQPRSAMFGKRATPGQLIYFNTFGPVNEYLQLVYALGDGLHDALDSIIMNGAATTFGSAGTYGTMIVTPGTASTGAHSRDQGNAWVAFYNGTTGQAADANLVANANPAGRWTTNDKLTGICYAVVTLKYDAQQWSGGVPQFLFVLRGLRLYDWRKDSTNGGSGTHRWGTPSTYEYSENNFVALYNYLRGVFVDTELVLGEGVPAGDLPVSAWTAAANASDESVALKAGGTEPRYRLSLEVNAEMQHRGVVEAMLSGAAGMLGESAGKFVPYAGVAQSVSMSFTDSDLVLAYPVTYASKRSRNELFNAVFSTYVSPAQNWQSIASPPRISPSDETIDGERLAVSRERPMVTSGTQTQRLDEIERRLARLQATGTVTLPFKFCVLEPGDWVTWTSPRFNGGASSTSRNFLVTSITVNDDHTVTLGMREIASSVFSWTAGADELDPQAAGTVGAAGTLIAQPASFGVAPITITGASGTKVPAGQATFTAINDATVTGVLIEYRIASAPAVVKQVRCDSPAGGAFIIPDVLQPATIYEARATLVTEPVRVTTWTNWTAFTTSSDLIGSGVIPGAVDIDALAARMQKTYGEARDNLQALADRVDKQSLDVANIIAQLGIDAAETRREVVQERSGVKAAITYVEKVRADDQVAFASYQVTVAAQFQSVTSSLTTTQSSLSSLTSSFAAYQITANARLGTAEANINTVTLAQASTAGSLATLTSNFNTRMGAAETNITSVTAAQSSTASSLASLTSNLSATYGSASALVSQVVAVTANVDGSAGALWRINLNVNGKVAGIRLGNSGSTSLLDLELDAVRIGKSGSLGFFAPFVFDVVNGWAYLENVRVKYLLADIVDTVHLKLNGVTVDKILDGAVTQEFTDYIASTSVFGGSPGEITLKNWSYTVVGKPSVSTINVQFAAEMVHVEALATGSPSVELTWRLYLDSVKVAEWYEQGPQLASGSGVRGHKTLTRLLRGVSTGSRSFSLRVVFTGGGSATFQLQPKAQPIVIGASAASDYAGNVMLRELRR